LGNNGSMPDWSSYFARMEGAPISIAVDLDLQRTAPVSEKPSAYTVAVALRDPDEHGMTGQGEYRVLAQIEEELAAALRPLGVIEVGRVTGRGMRTFHYYGPQIDELAGIVDDVMNMHAEYKYRALAAQDPAWTIYSAYLYPDEHQLAFANDMKALQVLLDDGDDFERERPIEHTIVFDDPAKCGAFAQTMAGHGYSVDIVDAPAAVRCTKVDTIDPFKITEARTALTTLAEEFGGTYSGWATSVQE
jgi:regulator of RNase E activity RraB